MITYYKDGNSYIPPHADNENSIKDHSIIYTVSVGETRMIKFTNTIGPLQEKYYELKHGSVFSMTRETQAIWLHGINRDPSNKGSRISFTFRHTTPVLNEADSKSEIPPISPPSNSNINNPQKRVLLLITDFY